MRTKLAIVAFGLMANLAGAVSCLAAEPDPATLRPEDYVSADTFAQTITCPPIHMRRREAVSRNMARTFAYLWATMGEPSLLVRSRQIDRGELRTFRFTWLRSFDQPMLVRLDEQPGGRLRLTAKRLSGSGGYKPGPLDGSITRILTPEEAKRVRAQLALDRPDHFAAGDCERGKDGAEWVFEVAGAGSYHLSRRLSPRDGPVHDLGLTFLRLTGWPLEPIY
jgi:hypothetical protein